MKAKTIARVTRILIAVIIAVIFAVPVLAGMNNFQLTSGEIIGVNSVYELDEMTSSDIQTNVKNAAGEMTEDYQISYTDRSDSSKRVIDLNFSNKSETERNNLLKEKADFLVANYKEKTAATLLDKDGKIVQQQMITATKNVMNTIIYTGMKLTSSAIQTFTPEASINTRINGELVKISDVDIIPAEDSYVVKMSVPYVVLATAMAQNQNVTLAIGLEYNTFFDLDIALDLPASMFLRDTSDIKVTPSSDKTAVDIDMSVIGLEDMEASVDNVKIVVKDSKIHIQTTNGKTIVDELKSYLNEKGELTFTIDGEKYSLDKEMSESLIKIVTEIMKGGS